MEACAIGRVSHVEDIVRWGGWLGRHI
ncbi:TPA: hypothetical protein N0F65_002918 [Lagenidium giganteum]|uniref:Uncharacterized protein n=1 Tax=Lagenidium giganteum TaxID=4803 RepID=A0AAV2Z839_9STRA|nr:TPA: hypothetical protein N0F65_002918 [Lagenidium giganteum]